MHSHAEEKALRLRIVMRYSYIFAAEDDQRLSAAEYARIPLRDHQYCRYAQMKPL